MQHSENNLKSVTPKRIFQQAQGFETAAALLFQAFMRGNAPSVTPARITCLALSIELAFKALILADTGQEQRSEHRYTKLFKKLRADTQSEIIAIHNQMWPRVVEGSQLPPGMTASEFNELFSYQASLQMSDRAFEQWRYSYEGRFKQGDGLNSDAILRPLKALIEVRYPDWFE